MEPLLYWANTSSLPFRRICQRASIMLTLSFLAASTAFPQANTGSVVNSPVYVNVYWDSAWDSDNPTMSMDAIDNFTSALVNSTYFSGLSEYGVRAASFYPKSFVADPRCFGGTSPPTLPLFSSEGFPAVDQFITCEIGRKDVPVGPNIIYNLFMAKRSIESDFFGKILACRNYLAYHYDTSPGVYQELYWSIFTVNFSNPKCSSSMNSLTVNLTHEMVEAATDMYPLWDVVFNPPDGNEIGDVAAKSCILPPTSFLWSTVTSDSFFSGYSENVPGVALYWSNATKRCLTFSDLTTPLISGVEINGVGQDTRLLIHGQGFGVLPQIVNFKAHVGTPVSLPAFTQLPYFAVKDETSGWEAGYSLVGDANLNFGSWADTLISIDGFATDFAPLPGDILRIKACNPASGSCATSSAAMPGVITSIQPGIGPVSGGTVVTIAGQNFPTAARTSVIFKDSQSQQFVNVPVTSVSSTSITTTTPRFVPGMASVQILTDGIPSLPNFFNFCPPTIASITPNTGPVSGGTKVTIGGSCFTGAAAVDFGYGRVVLLGAGMSVDSDSLITAAIPPGNFPLCGEAVDVQVRTPDMDLFASSPILLTDRFKYTSSICYVPIGANPSAPLLPLCASPIPQYCLNLVQPRLFNLRPPVDFTDLGGYESYVDAIEQVVREGILQPMIPGRFVPAAPVTRDQFAATLDQAFAFRMLRPRPSFSDISTSDPSYGAFQRAQPFLVSYQSRGGTYATDGSMPIERQEAAATAISMLQASGTIPQPKTPGIHASGQGGIEDLALVSPALRPDVVLAVRERVMTVDTRGNFRPNQFLTRADLAVLVNEVHTRIKRRHRCWLLRLFHDRP
jgi:hypothetical protein